MGHIPLSPKLIHFFISNYLESKIWNCFFKISSILNRRRSSDAPSLLRMLLGSG